MSVSRKPDSAKISRHLKFLQAQVWLGPAQKWWPKYLFRFDNIDAAVKILEDGKIFCRKTAVESGQMIKDCANPDVIASTPDKWKQYVRLYFRPRTPMQHNTEGFRLSAGNAHCPVPVVMLFDAEEILTRNGTRFSNGNLAARGVLDGDDAKFLESIPFDKVYHDHGLSGMEKSSIVFHRHAEVIVPNKLELEDALRYIVCRTQAEYETFLFLLNEDTRKKLASKIVNDTRRTLHYRRWTFIENVGMSEKVIQLKFNPSSKEPKPFNLRFEIREAQTGKVHSLQDESFDTVQSLNANIESVKNPENSVITVTLNGDIAYKNRFTKFETPF